MQSTFKFSPDGKYFSYMEKDAEGKRHVYVKDTETGNIDKVIEETTELIRGYGWANNNRIIYVKDKGGDENYHIFAVDLDGKNNVDLTPFDGVTVSILNFLKDQKDYIIIQMNKENAQIFEPFKINIKSGELEKLYENKDAANPISGYDFDKDGNLKSFTKQENGTEYVVYYKTSSEQDYKEVKRLTWKDNFSIIGFDYNKDNQDVAYVLSNMDNNTSEIILYDFAKNEIVKKIYNDDTYDMVLPTRGDDE